MSHIENNSKINCIIQKTICPRCKSENKITLTLLSVIASCGFSSKYNSNLTNTKVNQAPNTKCLLVEKLGREFCFSTKIIVINNKKDNNN